MNGSELNVIYLEGQFPVERTQTFEHVPFDVPEGVSQMHIRLSYDNQISSDPRESGGNVLDVGLFDARGTENGSEGFRGWSGSNKLDLVIGETWSTPPYRAGALSGGTWHLLLGPYKIGPTGLNWSARIEFDPDPVIPNQFVPPQVTLPESANVPEALPGWYRGDLHSHTVFSDGNSFPAQVAAAAKRAGLDFYGITDHNRAQSPVGLVPDGPGWPLLVPGVEVTTYAGHFNVWGTTRWYDFRHPDARGLQAAVDAANADGGFVSMNHPKPFGPPWEYPEVTGFAGIEVWNGWWNKLNDVSTRYWDARLRNGERFTPMGGSDMHQLQDGPVDASNPFVPPALGYPCTWVKLDGELTVSSVLDALRAGRVFISESPAGPQIDLSVTSGEIGATIAGAKGDALLLIGQNGVFAASAITEGHQRLTFPVPDDVTYLRAEIHHASGGIRALSNAVFR